MPKFHGKKGNVFWKGGAVAMSAQSWSLDITADIAETTSLQDTWKTFIAGQNEWTATVEGLHFASAASKIGISGEDASLGQDPTGNNAKLDLYLVYDTNDYNAIYGDAICVGITPVVDVNDAGKVSYKFQGIGSAFSFADTSPHVY